MKGKGVVQIDHFTVQNIILSTLLSLESQQLHQVTLISIIASNNSSLVSASNTPVLKEQEQGSFDDNDNTTMATTGFFQIICTELN